MKTFQTTLKLGFALSIACAILFSLPVGPSVQGKTGKNLTAASAASVRVVLDIGRRRNCNTDCCGGFGICRITVVASTANKRAVNGELTTTSDGKLTLALLGKAPDEGKTLILDEDVAIPAEAARKLGLKNATLLRGEYAFSASKAVLNARLVK